MQSKGIRKPDPEASIWVQEDGELKRLHSEELLSFYRSTDIVKAIKSIRLSWVGNVARMEQGWGAFKILIGKYTGKGPCG
jgi:hypothetical protein